MLRNYIFFLKDIQESCHKIQRYTAGFTLETLTGDEMRLEAVVRNIEIIGEAVKHIPEEIKLNYPDVNWKSIRGMRNIIVHEYFGLDYDMIWSVIQEFIPKIETQINAILSCEIYPENSQIKSI
ncbi:MAG: DUF86 domain-containing protein [Calditrichaeota bacterium]|nr:DUF86 domain-containing protein [Calditrichota bacterium]